MRYFGPSPEARHESKYAVNVGSSQEYCDTHQRRKKCKQLWMHFSLAITYWKPSFAFLEIVIILGKERFRELDEAWV